MDGKDYIQRSGQAPEIRPPKMRKPKDWGYFGAALKRLRLGGGWVVGGLVSRQVIQSNLHDFHERMVNELISLAFTSNQRVLESIN